MQIRQTVGLVLGVAGVLITAGHLVLMMIFETREPYHGLTTWVPLGVGLALIGIFLIRRRK